ncbi:hypothetical protein SDRG_04996 [Saprolegnia diclina VS20]|uniref:Potassium channel tetramerisation-type BTB domain-containing protein n=1 Tax=Saprolegnia diclina (strain VS20) TaxID=1156394 RepID=T0S3Q1_SAPDV|nr:hypothetical protein SDRG_04996 [Saprolegnia diclina VS20]EQC37392.1 hypothetical protein SDRG_04996 [Saprolegnia diclina VS20]|eukprot:XP_008608912.1 hypothetical protein SDRG_04996 [Saprolegnia diclina VS20]
MALRRRRTGVEVSALKAHFEEPFTPAHDESKPRPTARALCKHCGASVTYSTTRLTSHLGGCMAYDRRSSPNDHSMAAPEASGIVSERGTVANSGVVREPLRASLAALLGTSELDATLRDMATEMDSIVADVTVKESTLCLQEARIDAQVQLLTEIKADAQRENDRSRRDEPAPKRRAVATSNIVTLNVGGTRFMTADDTLLMWGTYFENLLSSPPNSDGEYFLDLNPDLFRRVIRLLRTANPLDTEGLSNTEKSEVQDMLDDLGIEWPQR